MCIDVCSYVYVFALGLQRSTVGIIHSQSLASGSVGHLFDADQTASAPARCSQRLNLKMDLTVQISNNCDHKVQ